MPHLLNPSKTAVLLLGACDWRAAGLPYARSYKNSMAAFKSWVEDSQGLAINKDNIIDLFNSNKFSVQIKQEIRDGLKNISIRNRDRGQELEDLLVYYVGHGHFEPRSKLVHLLLRTSPKGNECDSSLPAAGLASLLKIALPFQRHLIILDCCFAGDVGKEFMSPGAISVKTGREFERQSPKGGCVILCAAGSKEPAIGEPDAEQTAFSGALNSVLKSGDLNLPEEYNFSDLHGIVTDRILERYENSVPQPVLMSNSVGKDLTKISAFRNPTEPVKSVVSGSRPEFKNQPTHDVRRSSQVNLGPVEKSVGPQVPLKKGNFSTNPQLFGSYKITTLNKDIPPLQEILPSPITPKTQPIETPKPSGPNAPISKNTQNSTGRNRKTFSDNNDKSDRRFWKYLVGYAIPIPFLFFLVFYRMGLSNDILLSGIEGMIIYAITSTLIVRCLNRIF